MMKRPEKKIHDSTCCGKDTIECRCGAFDYNKCCDAWEKWLESLVKADVEGLAKVIKHSRMYRYFVSDTILRATTPEQAQEMQKNCLDVLVQAISDYLNGKGGIKCRD